MGHIPIDSIKPFQNDIELLGPTDEALFAAADPLEISLPSQEPLNSPSPPVSATEAQTQTLPPAQIDITSLVKNIFSIINNFIEDNPGIPLQNILSETLKAISKEFIPGFNTKPTPSRDPNTQKSELTSKVANEAYKSPQNSIATPAPETQKVQTNNTINSNPETPENHQQNKALEKISQTQSKLEEHGSPQLKSGTLTERHVFQTNAEFDYRMDNNKENAVTYFETMQEEQSITMAGKNDIAIIPETIDSNQIININREQNAGHMVVVLDARSKEKICGIQSKDGQTVLAIKGNEGQTERTLTINGNININGIAITSNANIDKQVDPSGNGTISINLLAPLSAGREKWKHDAQAQKLSKFMEKTVENAVAAADINKDGELNKQETNDLASATKESGLWQDRSIRETFKNAVENYNEKPENAPSNPTPQTVPTLSA